MVKIIAIVLFAAVLAMASAQYLAGGLGYGRGLGYAGLGYGGLGYARAPLAAGYAGLGHGYAGYGGLGYAGRLGAYPAVGAYYG